MKIMRVLLVLVTATLGIAAMASLAVRNAYGYVFGIGTSDGNITNIVLTDITAGPTYGRTYRADGWGWAWWSPGGLRWYKNSLPVNKSYFVDVYAHDNKSAGTGFYIGSENAWDHGDCKAPDVTFH